MGYIWYGIRSREELCIDNFLLSLEKGLQHLLRQQPAYKTAWLIRIHAARARTERRNVQHNDNYNLERDVMRRWLQVPTNN
jgi:hypothetical protein